MNLSDQEFTCDLIIARYKEKLDWLQQYKMYPFRNVIIYNKNEDDNDKSSASIGGYLNGKECIKINLPNEGRCDHTYLYHIIKNYDTLADVTIFSKGSSDMYRENKKLKFTFHCYKCNVIWVSFRIGFNAQLRFRLSYFFFPSSISFVI